MVWILQRNLKIPPTTLEFLAAQIEISTIADRNDFESVIIKEINKKFYFSKKEIDWQEEVDIILKNLNELETKTKLAEQED